LDREVNQFKWRDLLGKKIQNSQKETSYGFSIPLTGINFNTVQGYNAKFNLYYHQDWEKKKKSLKIQSGTIYGFSDQKWYPNLEVNYLMNKVYYSRLLVSAGRSLVQFDREQPIRLFFNDIYSLFFKENYSKWYENTHFSSHFKVYSNPIYILRLLWLISKEIQDATPLIFPISTNTKPTSPTFPRMRIMILKPTPSKNTA
jgi:hypothetical protein